MTQVYPGQLGLSVRVSCGMPCLLCVEVGKLMKESVDALGKCELADDEQEFADDMSDDDDSGLEELVHKPPS